jgi:RNA polymerase sigma factor (sigma-70 family)
MSVSNSLRTTHQLLLQIREVAWSFVVPEDSLFHDLICRIRNRDEAAATEMVRRYENAIRRVIRLNLRDRRMRRILDSMDVCQSVLASFFVRAALGQYDLETPEQLVQLLASIARNKLATQATRLQAQKRDYRREVDIDAQAQRLTASAADPSEQASAREMLQKVRDRLGEDERYLAEQRSLGRDWQEIATEVGATPTALRSKFSRAVNRVMAELGLNEGLAPD